MGGLSLAIDRCGRPAVLKSVNGNDSIDILDPVSTALVQNVPLIGGNQFDSLAVDGAGNC
jgi:hypothetical protein